MTTKNAILLMIKQSPGIEYNALLAKMAPDYGSVNSARAALSRAIKDMTAVGLIERQDHQLVATEKGQVQIQSEMKNKLVLKLNQTISDKDNVHQLERIVEQLATLIERSKIDADLFKAAKGAAGFSLRELRTIREHAKKRLHQLHYLQEVFEKQIDALQQLDFVDALELSLNNETLEKCKFFLEKAETQELVISSSSAETIESLALHMGEKPKSGTLVVSKEKNRLIMDFLSSQPANISITASTHRLDFSPQSVVITAPHQKISELNKSKSHASVV